MYNRLLDTFLVVAESGSFSAAARLLYISPSAVSQKISELEQNLEVPLFRRTTQGVALTEQGLLLQREAQSLREKSVQIRQSLLAVDARKNTICVGTSLSEKCRILFDLWMRYSGENPEAQIKLLTMDTAARIPSEVDLVECVRDGAPWQKGWSFLPTGMTPFCLGVNRENPLFEKETLTLEDLRQTTVVIIERERMHPTVIAMHAELERNGVHVLRRPNFGANVVWECSVHNYGIMVPACMQDVVMDVRIKPIRWDYKLEYGLFYREPAADCLQQFLRFAEKTCREIDLLSRYQ